MKIDVLLESCFDPSICNVALVQTGVATGRSIMGVLDEVDKQISMGRTKVSSGAAVFAAKTNDISDLRTEDEMKISEKTYRIYAVQDDLFGMSVLALTEIPDGY